VYVCVVCVCVCVWSDLHEVFRGDDALGVEGVYEGADTLPVCLRALQRHQHHLGQQLPQTGARSTHLPQRRHRLRHTPTVQVRTHQSLLQNTHTTIIIIIIIITTTTTTIIVFII